MITYKWLVEKMVTTGTNNAVTHVYWRCHGTNGQLDASCAGIRELILGDIFVPYGQLTEAQVLDWCFAPETITWTDVNDVEQSITKLLKNEAEAQIAGQIERQLNQKSVEPTLPWI